MKKRTAASIVRGFNALDLYDDGLKSIKIENLNTEKNSAVVRLELVDDGSGKTKWLSFFGCANIRQNLDIDVLAVSFFAQGQKAEAFNDRKRLEKLIGSHKAHWRTTYVPPSPENLAIREKLASLRSFVLFKIGFHGARRRSVGSRFHTASKGQAPTRKTA